MTRGSAQPVLLPTDTAEVDEVRRVVDALAEITKPDAASLEKKIKRAVQAGKQPAMAGSH